MLGDVNNDGVINATDMSMLNNAIALNYDHSTKSGQDVVEHPNGDLTGEQADRASLHRTGYVSNIDTILLNGYLDYKVEHPTATMEQYITYVDNKIPSHDRESLIRYIKQCVTGFKTYQLRHYYMNGTPSEQLGELCTAFAMVWTHAYITQHDYLGSLTDAQLERDANVAREAVTINPPDTKSGWQKTIYELYNDVDVKADSLTQAQVDAIKADYYPAGSVPETVTAEQLSAQIRSECIVDAAVEFYEREV